MRRDQVAVLLGMATGLGLAGCASSETCRSTAENRPPPAQATVVDGMTRSLMYLPTGKSETSTVLLERWAPTEVRAGMDYEYIMRVTNIASAPLKDVVVKDACAENYVFVSSSPDVASRQPDPLAWNLGDLAPCASKQIVVKGKAAPGATAITNCATVSYNDILCASSAVVEPALKVVMVAPAEASLCDNVPFTYTVTNTGTGTIRDVKVNYTIPMGWTTEKAAIGYDVGTLAAGETKEFKIFAKPNKTGPFTGTVSALGAGDLTATGTPVDIVIKAPALALTADAPDTAMIGRDIPFAFTIKNTGDMASADTVITAPVPDGATFVRADAGGAVSFDVVTWNLGALGVNESRTVTMFAKNTGVGIAKAAATATGACAPPVTDSCTVSIAGVPDIGTNLFDETGVVTVDYAHMFHYTVKNQGQIDLTGVVMVAELDPGLEFVSTDWVNGATVKGNLVTWKIGAVKVGELQTFKITCKGIKEGELQIQTATTSDQTPRPVHNDEQVNYIAK